MHQIIYMSRGVEPMSEEQLRELLLQARAANEAKDITGALIYGDNQFMQIIEGAENDLVLLYSKLINDPRHQNVVKLADKEIIQRNFNQWSMAFNTVSPEEFAQLQGYVEPDALNLKAPGLNAADSLLLEMMKSFILNPRK